MPNTLSDSMSVFNRDVMRRRRERAAAVPDDARRNADFLFREAAVRLADRLHDVTRDFPLALDLGCRSGQVAEMLRGSSKVGALMQADISPGMARAAQRLTSLPTIIADEEFLPIREQSLDLVLSNLSLHWVNDLPGALVQIRRALMPNGLFLATMFGAQTLNELRIAFLEAEAELHDGVSPHISPFVEVRDAGNLLNRAGFALPVVDADDITVTYADMFKLMADLRAMAETNAVTERRRTFSRRATFLRAAEIYAAKFADARGRITATFQIVTMTAWAPHASQQQPLRPGSAKSRLADALDSTEISFPGKGPT